MVIENYSCIEEVIHEFTGVGEVIQWLDMQDKTTVKQLQCKKSLQMFHI